MVEIDLNRISHGVHKSDWRETPTLAAELLEWANQNGHDAPEESEPVAPFIAHSGLVKSASPERMWGLVRVSGH